MITTPTLAAKIHLDELDRLDYPVLVSPKYDGVRVLVVNGIPQSRTMKSVPNRALVDVIMSTGLNNVDGEIVIDNKYLKDKFNETSALFRSTERKSFRVFYCLFDSFNHPARGYENRIKELPWRDALRDYYGLRNPNARLRLFIKQPLWAFNPQEIHHHLEVNLNQGHEGIMIRDPKGPYKQGRSTVDEQILVKLKPEGRATGTVVGFEQLIDIHGQFQEKLGALLVESTNFNTFSIGTGFTQDQRNSIWRTQYAHKGRRLLFKYAAGSEKQERPRFPVFDRWCS